MDFKTLGTKLLLNLGLVKPTFFKLFTLIVFIYRRGNFNYRNWGYPYILNYFALFNADNITNKHSMNSVQNQKVPPSSKTCLQLHNGVFAGI